MPDLVIYTAKHQDYALRPTSITEMLAVGLDTGTSDIPALMAVKTASGLSLIVVTQVSASPVAGVH
jgi:hypothetical protein